MPDPDWSDFARADFLRIIAYIAEEDPAAAQALKDRIERKVTRLTEHPRLYRVGRVKTTREMVVHPNYLVVYTVDAHRVRILRLLHAKQRWP